MTCLLILLYNNPNTYSTNGHHTKHKLAYLADYYMKINFIYKKVHTIYSINKPVKL